ncbi:Peroxisomal multifunctional enzyme type 2 [Gryllus bimaculatus]|nr:Peroxisomal multifunctional enzyme type 2 [Gryllus bimaculatus]
MLLRIYSLLVLLYDVIYLLLGCAWAVIESLYQFISPPKEKSVVGERVLIVGAGRGIGRELTLQFAALGADVVCWDINSEANEATKQHALEQGKGQAYAYTCNVAERDQVISIAEKVRKDVGDITVLIHCCGVPSPRSLVAQPAPAVRQTMDVSILSHFWILEAFLPQMRKNNKGHIVALTSVAGLTGIKDQVPLCASQFAVQGLIEALSEELRTTKSSNKIFLTLVHIYPFIVSSDLAQDIRLRIPSYFGVIDPKDAANQIITAMRRNYAEISIPRYLLYLGSILRLMPRKVSIMFRDLLDTGVDFG